MNLCKCSGCELGELSLRIRKRQPFSVYSVFVVLCISTRTFIVTSCMQTRPVLCPVCSACLSGCAVLRVNLSSFLLFLLFFFCCCCFLFPPVGFGVCTAAAAAALMSPLLSLMPVKQHTDTVNTDHFGIESTLILENSLLLFLSAR